MTEIVIRNNIIQSAHARGGYALLYLTGTENNVTIDHNLFYESTGNYNVSPNTFGTNYTKANPLLMSPTTNFRIPADSPAKDAGSPDSAPSNDYSGNLRPSGSAYDIGAYEYITEPTVNPTPTTTQTATPALTFTSTPDSEKVPPRIHLSPVIIIVPTFLLIGLLLFSAYKESQHMRAGQNKTALAYLGMMILFIIGLLHTYTGKLLKTRESSHKKKKK
jgi:hypothetical protein